MPKMILIATVILAGWCFQVSAQEATWDTPVLQGTGCPADSIRVMTAPSHDRLQIHFENLASQAGVEAGRRYDEKTCELSLAVKVPKGFRLGVSGLDARGFNFVSRGGFNSFAHGWTWAGREGVSLARQFHGPLNDNFTLSWRGRSEDVLWSACGQTASLVTRSSIASTAGPAMAVARGALNSNDVGLGLQYRLQWEKCAD